MNILPALTLANILIAILIPHDIAKAALCVLSVLAMLWHYLETDLSREEEEEAAAWTDSQACHELIAREEAEFIRRIQSADWR